MSSLRILVAFLAAVCLVCAQAQQPQAKKRLIVLSDIEADPDDSQSLVRLLLYANDIDIEALIATTSTHQRARVAPESMHKILDAYGRVQPNLLKHDKAYPTAQALHATVRQGLPVYGMEGVGEGKDSEGSEFILKILEKPDPRPVWVSVWGGPNCLAQALWKIQKIKPAADAEKLYAKLRVYTISDQDDSGPWMRKTFPSLFYVVSPGSGYGSATWNAIASSAPGSNTEVVSAEWLAKNIQQGHGPLGAQYPDIAYSMEGDTPSYLGLIRNGLNEMEHPNWGGWGGRYELYLPGPPAIPASPGGGRGAPVPETRPIWTNAEDTYRPSAMVRRGGRGAPDTTEYKTNAVTLWRWREDFQNDFAARMTWTTQPFNGANHPPVPVLNIPLAFTVKSGDLFKLDADGTTDPDGDSLSYFWFQYPEAGTYKGAVSFSGPAGNLSPNLYNVHTIKAPEVDSPQTVHFILRVRDKGSPPLTRYQRVIVTIVPR